MSFWSLPIRGVPSKGAGGALAPGASFRGVPNFSLVKKLLYDRVKDLYDKYERLASFLEMN